MIRDEIRSRRSDTTSTAKQHRFQVPTTISTTATLGCFKRKLINLQSPRTNGVSSASIDLGEGVLKRESSQSHARNEEDPSTPISLRIPDPRASVVLFRLPSQTSRPVSRIRPSAAPLPSSHCSTPTPRQSSSFPDSSKQP